MLKLSVEHAKADVIGQLVSNISRGDVQFKGALEILPGEFIILLVGIDGGQIVESKGNDKRVLLLFRLTQDVQKAIYSEGEVSHAPDTCHMVSRIVTSVG